jgi:hypothetical protein
MNWFTKNLRDKPQTKMGEKLCMFCNKYISSMVVYQTVIYVLTCSVVLNNKLWESHKSGTLHGRSMVLFKQRTTLVYSKTASIITWQPLSREHFLSSVDVQSKYFDRLVISTKWLLFQKGAMSTKFYIFSFGVVKQQSINTKNNLCMGFLP